MGENIGFNLATFGSAYAGGIVDIVELLKEALRDKKSVEEQALLLALEEIKNIPSIGTEIEGERFFSTAVNNFMCGLQSSLGNAEHIYLMDAGSALIYRIRL